VSVLLARRRAVPVFRTSAQATRALGGALAAEAVAAVLLVGAAWTVWPAPTATVASAAVLAVALWAGIPLRAAWVRARRMRAGADDAYRRVGSVVWSALRRAGRVSDADAGVAVDTAAGIVDMSVHDVPVTDQRIFAEALGELFGPVRTPRFLLETDRGGRSGVVRAVLRLSGHASDLLAVPTLIGRRQADAADFAAAWNRELGACTLHAMDRPAALALLSRARRNAPDGATRAAALAEGSVAPTTIREVWR
jgi:hypothetical protein